MNVEISNDNMCFTYFTESLCLDIQNKMSIFNSLLKFVRIMNLNEDDYEGKLYGISTNHIRKLINFYFTILRKKESSNSPLKNMYSLKQKQKWNVFMYPYIFSGMSNPHVIIHFLTFLRQT